MAASTTPLYTDRPLSLILTPKFQTGKDDPFTIEASHMALSHNAFIRGFNSIYEQAPRLTLDADKTDFVGYCVSLGFARGYLFWVVGRVFLGRVFLGRVFLGRVFLG
ncbi:hypothetical protein F5Y16DRAFT_406937 [Xylariaceae sp. FL0255]|nr:hypothetical protein F5Y16DRAFT_406937 [Xylariaceae sp. FL0255]